MKVYSKSDIGLMRSSNQDYCIAGEFSDSVPWAVVCDGMGGANGGATASRVASETISEKLKENYHSQMNGEEIRELIQQAVKLANEKVYNMSLNNPELSGMGTTVVCAVVKDSRIYIIHAGDSRAYLYENGAVRQITKDHSMVQELIDIGEITKEEARSHPHRNIITRALGTKPELKIDYNTAEFKEGSVLIMCTDGLSNYITEDSLLEFVKTTEIEELTDKLIQTARNLGGSDNITAAVIAE